MPYVPTNFSCGICGSVEDELHSLAAHEHYEQREQQRAVIHAQRMAAGSAALSNLAWWLDEYGYRDEDELDIPMREHVAMLFDAWATMSDVAKPVLRLLGLGPKDVVTAGMLREAMK